MAVTLGSSTLVTVYGGSGFLGRYVVQQLARAGCRIRVAVRRPDLAGFLQPLGSVGQIVAVQANVRDEASVRRAAEGADAIVNLVGILQPQGRQKFTAVHLQGPTFMAAAARDFGARAFVHVSAIGADRRSRSVYARSKGEGETEVLKAYPRAVILRPSLVFGPEDQFFNRFASLSRFSPVLPLIGGRTRFQPVFVGDVARAVIAALSGRATEGKIYELGGPQVFTFREIYDLIGKYTLRQRAYLPVPIWAAKIQGFVLQNLPGAPLTLDQVRLLQRDNVVSEESVRNAATLEALGIAPLSVEAVVPDYLKRFRPKGEFQSGAAG
jgi:NADH dehydrogenase